MATALQIRDSTLARATRFGIVIKNAPRNMSNEAIKAILEKYGSIEVISGPLKSGENHEMPFRFANCTDEVSYDAVLNGMKQNNYNLRVEPKKPIESKIFYSNKIGNGVQLIEQEEMEMQLNTTRTAKLNDINVHYCFVCNQIATKECSRCEEKYCGPECQSKDWSKHKYVCFAKPALRDITNINNKVYNEVQIGAEIKKQDQNDEPISVEKQNKNEVQTGAEKGIEQNNTKKSTTNNAFPTINMTSHTTENLLSTISPSTNNACSPKNVSPVESDESPTASIIFSPKSDQLQRFTIKKSPFPSSGQNVAITHIESLKRIYIRSIETTDADYYAETIGAINKLADKSKALQKVPDAKSLVLASYENFWYRAVVVKVKNESEIKVAYVDFGNSEIKKLDELREFNTECCDYKRLTHCISLKGLENLPDEYLPECIKYLQSFVDNYTQLKVKYDENEKHGHLQSVELIILQQNKSINEELKKYNLKSKKESPAGIINGDTKMENLMHRHHIKYEVMPNSVNTEIVILDNSLIEGGFIHCALNGHLEKIAKYVKIFSEHASKDFEPYAPKDGEIVLIKISENPENWHRGCCEGILENGRFELQQIDFGNIIEVSSKNIRKFPPELNFPCLTIQCFIKGFMTAVKSRKIQVRHIKPIGELLKRFSVITLPEVELGKMKDTNYITLPQQIYDEIKRKNIVEINNEEFMKTNSS